VAAADYDHEKEPQHELQRRCNHCDCCCGSEARSEMSMVLLTNRSLTVKTLVKSVSPLVALNCFVWCTNLRTKDRRSLSHSRRSTKSSHLFTTRRLTRKDISVFIAFCWTCLQLCDSPVVTRHLTITPSLPCSLLDFAALQLSWTLKATTRQILTRTANHHDHIRQQQLRQQ
jgi:hypothetical protein